MLRIKGENEIKWKFLLIQTGVLAACISLSIFSKPMIFVTFGITAMTCLLDKCKYAFCQLFFLLPFTVIFKTSPESSSYFAYLMLLFSVCIVARGRINILYLGPISIYLLLGMFNKPDLWLKLMSGWVLLIYFVKIIGEEDAKYVTVSLSLGLIISSLWGLVKWDIPRLVSFMNEDNGEYMLGERIIRFSGLYYDPNYYSVTVIMALFLLLHFGASNKLDKKIAFPLAIVLFFFGALSYSKIFILSAILVILTQLKDIFKFSKNKIIPIFVAILAVAVLIPYFLQSDYVAKLSSRLQTDDISNGRIGIASSYLNYIFTNIDVLFLGVGLGGDLYNDVGPHNTFIEAIYFLGLFGSILYFATIRKIFSSNRLIERRVSKNYSLLFIFCIMIGTLGMIVMNDFMFYLMLVWYTMNIDYQTSTE